MMPILRPRLRGCWWRVSRLGLRYALYGTWPLPQIRRWRRRIERRLATRKLIWITAGRVRIHVTKMATSHIKNARAFVARRAPFDKQFDTRWLSIFDEELERRGWAEPERRE